MNMANSNIRMYVPDITTKGIAMKSLPDMKYTTEILVRSVCGGGGGGEGNWESGRTQHTIMAGEIAMCSLGLRVSNSPTSRARRLLSE